jgi:hypothetical protein
MATNHIHLPPMPKPEEFGINEETWQAYGNPTASGHWTAKTKVDAYQLALEVWKQAAVGLNK